LEREEAAHFFEPKLIDLAKAINLCIENKLIEPALILLYSAIDILGGLSSPVGRSSKKSFIAWTNEYILKERFLACTAEELYGARCGLLHALSFESQLSQRGQLRTISYAWGTADVDKLQKSINLRGRSDEIVAVHIVDLYSAWLEGVERFIEDINNNSAIKRNVYSKADKLFAPLKPGVVDRTNDLLEKIKKPK